MEIEREIVLPVPREEAWEALTERGAARGVVRERRRARRRRPGGDGVFEWDNGEVRRAVVETVEEQERLVLRWDDDGVVELELDRAPRRHPGPRPRDGARVGHRARAPRVRRMGDGDRVGAVFAALADPSRRYVVERLARPRPCDADRARGGAADDAPGGCKAPRDARARRARPRQPRGPEHRLPAGSPAAARRHRVDGPRRRGVGRAARRAGATTLRGSDARAQRRTTATIAWVPAGADLDRRDARMGEPALATRVWPASPTRSRPSRWSRPVRRVRARRRVVLGTAAVDEDQVERRVRREHRSPVAFEDVDVRVVREHLDGGRRERRIALGREERYAGRERGGEPGGADAGAGADLRDPLDPRRPARTWSSVPSSSRQLFSNPSAAPPPAPGRRAAERSRRGGDDLAGAPARRDAHDEACSAARHASSAAFATSSCAALGSLVDTRR